MDKKYVLLDDHSIEIGGTNLTTMSILEDRRQEIFSLQTKYLSSSSIKDNKDKISIQTKHHYQKNKEKIQQYQKQHYQDNADKIKEYRIDNKDKKKEYDKKKYQAKLFYNKLEAFILH